MGAVITAVGRDHHDFIPLACVNVVVASNAGGVASPFGDITTLMVWQQNKVSPRVWVVESSPGFRAPAKGVFT